MRQNGFEQLPQKKGEVSARATGRDTPADASLPGHSSIAPLPVSTKRPPGHRPPQPAREYTRPRYTERFHCISSDCEDTCCQGWGVPIDRATYEKYRSVEKLKPHLGTLIVLNTDRPTSAHYAAIPLKANATCSFLEDDKLCGIQKQLGEEMLSVTCATYPRAISTIAGKVEEALNLSCPEAARVTLLDPQLLGDAPAAEHYAAVRKHAGRPLGRQEALLAVREFVLLLLRDRSYPLWQRLYLLGTLCRRLNALSLKMRTGGGSVAAWCEANPAAVAQLLEDSARGVLLGTLRPAMHGIETRPDQQLSMVMELLRTRLAQPPVPTRVIECIRDLESGVGSKTAQSEAEILTAYAEGYRHYATLMGQHPHVMENYLINHVFKNNYPFGRKKPAGTERLARRDQEQTDAECEHISLCIHAALIQTMLTGMAAHYRDAFDLGHVVKLVQSLARTFEHSEESAAQIQEFARAKGLSNPRNMAVLLRQDGYPS